MLERLAMFWPNDDDYEIFSLNIDFIIFTCRILWVEYQNWIEWRVWFESEFVLWDDSNIQSKNSYSLEKYLIILCKNISIFKLFVQINENRHSPTLQIFENIFINSSTPKNNPNKLCIDLITLKFCRMNDFFSNANK